MARTQADPDPRHAARAAEEARQAAIRAAVAENDRKVREALEAELTAGERRSGVRIIRPETDR